jgi:hypothetical protein
VQWARDVIERQVPATRLVDDLLDVSISRGKINLQMMPVDLAAVVAARRISHPHRRPQTLLVVSLPEQGVRVEGDRPGWPRSCPTW